MKQGKPFSFFKLLLVKYMTHIKDILNANSWFEWPV